MGNDILATLDNLVLKHHSYQQDLTNIACGTCPPNPQSNQKHSAWTSSGAHGAGTPDQGGMDGQRKRELLRCGGFAWPEPRRATGVAGELQPRK
eukprot:608877-Amphidinium_carterae.1